MNEEIATFLTKKVAEYNQVSFIESDPIAVPHYFSKKQDIEIAGFFAAIFAWGNRRTIIAKAFELMHLMDNEPYDFIKNHQESDRKRLLGFKHRTFNATDLLWFVHVLQNHYQQHASLATAFFPDQAATGTDIVKNGLTQLQVSFFQDPEAPQRTKKHLSSPARNSSCKRLNMYLRWMVRKDDNGVDFGIWRQISPSELIIPIDVHVARVAKRFGLLARKQPDWIAAEELTAHLRELDPTDPTKFDFALFGLGVIEKF